MADKPSRALILYGYGLAPLIKPSHSHLHSLTSIASCGFLALDSPPPSPSPEGEDEKLIRELAQLLDANEAASFSAAKDSELEAPKHVPSMMERFMGMRAALVTSSSVVKHFGEKLGFTVIEFDKLTNGQPCHLAADDVLKLLGFQDGQTLEKDYFDLVLMHYGAYVKDSAENDLDYINSLVGRILQVALPGSEIGSRLHLSLVVSHGVDSEDYPNLSFVSSDDGSNSHLQYLFPRQSYTLKGVTLRDGIRHHHPMLVAQWQDAVTRKDKVQEFSFNEFKKNSGNLAIAADRFLYEVAFKLWKAPKYGA